MESIVWVGGRAEDLPGVPQPTAAVGDGLECLEM